MSSLSLVFDVLARDRASKTLNDIGNNADKLGGKLGGVGTAAKGALGGAAVAGVGLLGAAFVQGVKDATSFQTLMRKTEAVIASTGNAAGISVEGVQDLAGSLESISGVDEEQIINAQNVLATFTKIKNAGPDKVFDDAAKAALNMSVALGTDLQGATLQVGKALNDPLKGVTALSRAGVQFTQQQKDQIRTLVETGDTLGAQKVILGELETQFGGAAEAAGSGFAGSMARLQDAVGDAFREIATALLPTLTKLAEYLAENLPGAIERFRSGFEKVSRFYSTNVLPILRTLGDVLVSIARFIDDPVIPAVGRFIEIVTTIATTVGDVVGSVGRGVDSIVSFFTGLPERLAQGVGDIFGFLRRAFVGVINFIVDAWNGLDFTVPSFEAFGRTIGGFTLGLPQIDRISTGGSGTNRGGLRTMHTGGVVTPWGVEPLRSDEVMAKLQVGETVLPRGSGLGATHNWYINEAQHYGPDDLLRAAAARLA